MENNSIVPGTNFTIDEAIDWLMFCSDQYYILGSSPVSDADYDYVCAATRAVIPEHPFFAGIRIALNTNKKIQLKNKLYSLRQIKTAQDAKTGACSLSETFLELDDWLTKTRTKLNDDKVVCFAMPKYSGLTVVIYYENGYLISAATSGDGLEGRDVTEHIKRIDGIPFKIPGNLDIEIRGDVIMRNSKFASYTQNEFNDARSVVAGTLNLDDYELVSDRGLDFCPWDVLLNNEEFSLCEKEKFRLLREWKFHNIGEFGEVTSIDDIKNYFIQMDNVRKTIGSDNRPIQEDSMLDGIVVTIANEKMQKKLGYHNACPEFSIVIKFASEVVEATVISIDWQLNRHGVFSPVAVLEPVILEGMLVFKAMLNNYARVERDCIGIGTRVLIRKAGPVLPQIINIIDKISTNNNAPEICPSCKEPVTQQNVNLVCLNSNCKTQLFERLYHFVSIVIPINIGLDRVFVKSLFDANLARSPADLYLITRSALIATYGIGQNKASLFLSAIEGSKKIKLAALLRSLSIPLTGEAWAKKLASLLEYDGSRLLNPIGMTYEGSKKLLYEKKCSIIPINVFTSFCCWFCTPANIQLISDLLAVGIEVLMPQEKEINGIRVCVAGKTVLPKKNLEELLRFKGYIIDQNISKKTNVLIYNTPSNALKIKKAMKFGIEIIPEAVMLARLEGQAKTPMEAYKNNIKTTVKTIPVEIIWQEAIKISKEQEQLRIDKKESNRPNPHKSF